MTRPALTVVAGLTYRERSQVLNRWLVPAYQTSIRWTGNRLDAEDATTWVLINEISRLDLPDLVQLVDERLAETTLDAIGRHWSERYGISQLRCSAIQSVEAALVGQPTLGIDALTDRLTADERLLIVLRFLRGHALPSISAQLKLSARASANMLFRALLGVAARLGLDADAADTTQVDLIAAYVGDLVARRRPLRFEATPNAWPALVAATHIQAAIAGNDLPRLRFVRSLEGLGSSERFAPHVTASCIWSA